MKVILDSLVGKVCDFIGDVEMEEKDFKKLKDLDMDDISFSNEPVIYGLLETYINPSDIFDSEQEFRDVEVYKAQ